MALAVTIISNGAYSLSNFRGPLIGALVAAGCKVDALAPDFDETTRAAVRRLGADPVDFSLQRAGMNPIRDLRDAWRLSRLLRRTKPDIVFSYFMKPVIYGTLAARAAGVKRRFALVAGLGYVFTEDGSKLSAKRRALQTISEKLYRAAFRACDRVFLQNADDVAELVGRRLLDPAKVVQLQGTGVDLAHYTPSPPVTQPPTFLLMARLLKEKGIEEYAAAARMVRARHPEARFLLLGGTDPNPGALDVDRVRGWVGAGDIEWQDHVTDVRPWIAGCSVYVLPSYREGKPRSTQEALAMGRAVVTTDAPGCRDTVVEGVNGFMVPIRDAQALAAAMTRFIDDPGLVEAMGRESRKLAEERFDADKINRIILETMGIAAPRRLEAPVR